MHHSGSQPAIIQRQDYLERIYGVPTKPQSLPDCELFALPFFQGATARVSIPVPQIKMAWGHDLASLIIHNGIWRFYRHPNFGNAYPVDMGPGRYPDIQVLWGGHQCGSIEPVRW